MNRTDQAHAWALYAGLIIVLLTACGAFFFTEKLSEGSFVGVLMAVVTSFYGKPKPESHPNGNGHATPPAAPPVVPPVVAP